MPVAIVSEYRYNHIRKALEDICSGKITLALTSVWNGWRKEQKTNDGETALTAMVKHSGGGFISKLFVFFYCLHLHGPHFGGKSKEVDEAVCVVVIVQIAGGEGGNTLIVE